MMIAVVRVRGIVGLEHSVGNTLKSLRLYKRNYCTIVRDLPEIKGMITKAKDYITWGSLDEETAKMLEQKSKSKYYRLNSPRKGFGRKGVKHPFSKGGALGDRKEKINDLIRRML